MSPIRVIPPAWNAVLLGAPEGSPSQHITKGSEFSGTTWLLLGTLLAILLAPLLTYPLGPDSSLFFVSGQKILQGAIHYRDIVDVKPPLIYYIYATAIGLFGASDFGVRLLDYLLQAFTCFALISVIRRVAHNDWWAFFAGLLYIIGYVSEGFGSVGYAECYVALFAIPMLWIQFERRAKWGWAAIGVLGGFLFLLKFTFAVVMLSAMAAEFIVFEQPIRRTFQQCGWMVLGFLLPLLLFAAYLFGLGAWQGFLEMNEFLRGYMTSNGNSLGQFMRNITAAPASFLANGYSLSILVLTLAGIALSMRLNPDAPGNRLLRAAGLTWLLLILSVAVEQKYLGFYLHRLLAFSSLLATLPLMEFFRRFCKSRRGQFTAVASWFLVIGLIAFSPISRYFYHSSAGINTALHGDAGFDAFYESPSVSYTFHQLRQIGDYVKAHQRPDDKMFVMSGIAGMIYHFAGHVPDFKIYHSAFLIAPFAPHAWKDSTSAFLLTNKPRFLVIQRNERIPDIAGSNTSAEEALRSLPGIDTLLTESYSSAITTKWFQLLELKSGN